MSPVKSAPSGRVSAYHVPVLLAEIETLFASASNVLDCTLGGGGHAFALLERGVRVTGIDRDPRALASARERLSDYERAGQFRALLGNYADLGADELLNTIDEVDLSALLRAYADEPRAARLAREIVRRRERRPFATADDLVDAIRAVLGARSGPPDFARIFQAVRIAVNDELTGLERALPKLRDRLTPGGVLAIISYHSGEDRLVKHAYREWSAACTCPPRQMMCTCRGVALGETITKRPINAADAEIASNTRARSARLRAWRRVVPTDYAGTAAITGSGAAR